MKNRCSDELTRYIRVAFISLVLILFVAAEVRAEEAGSHTRADIQSAIESVRKTDDIPADVMESAKQAVDTFQKGQASQTYQGITEHSGHAAGNNANAEEFIKGAYPDLDLAAIKKAGQQQQSCKSKDTYDQGTILYFFSFSMPDQVIKDMASSAIKMNRGCNNKIVMLLRGFVDNNLKATIAKLYGLVQQADATNYLPVEIHPEMFSKYSISEVPVIIQQKGGALGVIKGDTSSLKFAMEKFGEELKDYGKYGNTYPIKEEDFLEFVASKQKVVEQKLAGRMEHIKSTMYVLKRFDGQFEQAAKDRKYYIDPSIILSEDITDNNGKVLFTKGTRYSPADYIKLGRYIVIDGNTKKQVEYALKGNFKKIMLISGDMQKLTKKYKQRFYFVNDRIIEKFQIKHVPAIIEGEDQYVSVTEKAL